MPQCFSVVSMCSYGLLLSLFHCVVIDNKKMWTHVCVLTFPLQILSPLLDLNQNRSKLKLYISHLTSLCQERDPIILQDFAPPPAYHRADSASWHTQLHSMTQEQVGRLCCVCTSERWQERGHAKCVFVSSCLSTGDFLQGWDVL